MRKDVIIDRQQVRCKNASHLGFDKAKAQVGDIVIYRDDNDTSHIGRMIGRIRYAPGIGGSPVIRNHILAVVLGERIDCTFERWINPDSVISIQSIRNHRDIMTWFLSNQMVSAPLQEVRECAAEMWSTLDAYRAWKNKRDLDIAEYESRHSEVSE